MSLFVIFKFPTVPSPVRPDARRGRNPEDRWVGLHRRGHCRRDIVGAQDRGSAEGIPEKCCSVFPSVARGYSLCYTGNTAREVK
ncbi:unnamed protein product, partial [Staurois parvus]